MKTTVRASDVVSVSVSELEISLDQIKIEALRSELADLAIEDLQLQDQESTAKLARANIKKRLNEIGEIIKVKRVSTEGWTVLKTPWSHSQIKAEILLEEGVPMPTIEKATVVQKGYNYLVKRVGEK